MRWQGEVRRLPPAALLRAARAIRRDAPIDVDLRSWLTDRVDDEAAAAVSGLAGVLTFDHDPGRLSAEFVWSRVRRILAKAPPVARYAVGGWGPVVDRVAAHARAVGVRIETNAKVDVLPAGLVILAVDPPAARRLLGDDQLRANGPRVALLDVGLVARRGDPYLDPRPRRSRVRRPLHRGRQDPGARGSLAGPGDDRPASRRVARSRRRADRSDPRCRLSRLARPRGVAQASGRVRGHRRARSSRLHVARSARHPPARRPLARRRLGRGARPPLGSVVHECDRSRPSCALIRFDVETRASRARVRDSDCK